MELIKIYMRIGLGMDIEIVWHLDTQCKISIRVLLLLFKLTAMIETYCSPWNEDSPLLSLDSPLLRTAVN